MTQMIPVKETRDRIADLLQQVESTGKQFVITKFGKPMAMLVPVDMPRKKKVSGIQKSFGAWKKRTDITDTKAWVATLRERMSLRS